MPKLNLSLLEPGLRYFLASFLFLISMAVTSGLIYVAQNTSMEPAGISQQFAGDETDEQDDAALQENYPKTLVEMLLTTHSHLAGFAFIFFLIGSLFYFTTTLSQHLKNILLIEPFFTVFLTFASIWGVRFVHPFFSYIIFISGTLTYLAFYTMSGILFYELLLKNRMFSTK